MLDFYAQSIRPILAFYVLPILIPFLIAYLVHILSEQIARRLIPIGRLARHRQTKAQRQARRQTLLSLVSALITSVAFLVAFLAALAPIVGLDSLIWMVGLFGAGIGFSAKPFIGDVMTGMMFILEADFDVGEKIEISGIEGVVEEINLRTTQLRGDEGEVYIIPNGEIRAVRNFSRGRFTPIRVKIRVPSTRLKRAVGLLEDMGAVAVQDLPNLLEPWRVIAEDATMSDTTELTLISQAKFGTGAELRPRLLAYVQDHLQEAGILEADAQPASPHAT